MTEPNMTHRERTQRALAHQATDRAPRDFAAEPAVWGKLQRHLGTSDSEQILRALDIDCRVLSYDAEAFCHPPHDPAPPAQPGARAWKREVAPDVFVDVWGARRRVVSNEYGTYEELCDYPLAGAESVADLKQYPWPTPDWWNFGLLPEMIEQVNPGREYHLRWRVGAIFETAWSLRGFDRFLADLIIAPDLAGTMLDRILEVHLENLRQVMALAGDRIDMIYTYDDLAHQQGLLISPELWRQTIGPRQAKLFAAAKACGKPVMLHCCGAVTPLLEDLIALGLDVLNPIQPRAQGMEFERLKQEFGARLTFHGGIDIQELLPRGTPAQVAAEAARACAMLGQGGGYILAPAHHIQADTPVENVLALYGLTNGTAR